MLSEAGVTSNPGRPDANAGRRGAGVCSRLTVPQGVRRAPRPDHESPDSLQNSDNIP